MLPIPPGEPFQQPLRREQTWIHRDNEITTRKTQLKSWQSKGTPKEIADPNKALLRETNG